MKAGKIRPLALCVVWRGAEILVMEGHDSSRNLTFYRPLGGGIEFGERGIEACAREMREELGVEMLDLRPLGMLESIFTFENAPGHEIVLLYEGRFADQALYDQEVLIAHEDDAAIRAVWRSITDFDQRIAPLFPDGLLELLIGDDDDGALPA